MMFDAIAQFINRIIALIDNLSKAAAFASNPIGGIFAPSNEQAVPATGGEAPVEAPSQQAPVQAPSSGKRAFVTVPERITARFNDTGSPAWRNQPGGKHLGTDFGGANGSPVFAPWSMNIVAIGSYADEGRKGDYVIGKLANGVEYYTGHLRNVRVKVGDYVKQGSQIAEIGYYNHTHVQLRVNGTLTDFEVYEKQ